MIRIQYTIIQIIFIFIVVNCAGQTTQREMKKHQIVRKPAVAGQFYEGNSEALLQEVVHYFKIAESDQKIDVRALIVPHAGYVFSGGVAATAYNTLNPSKQYENVFILASSHTAYFEGASVYSAGNYLTPLGEVKVNSDLAEDLIYESEVLNFISGVHKQEHSIEVQLPFLQYLYKDGLQIVPIVIGTRDKVQVQQIAETLRPYFNDNNLFVISSDFSHYPEYDDAVRLDNELASVIMENSIPGFLEAVHDKNNNDFDNLATRACGWTSILTLLYLTDEKTQFEFSHLLYKNSGDAVYGDKSRVVGYHAIAVNFQQPDVFFLDKTEQDILLDIARSTIETYVSNGYRPDIDFKGFPQKLLLPCGAFVTIHKEGKLRGCIGNFSAEQPLWQMVQEMAVAACSRDTRFLPVESDELDQLHIEISVLSPLRKTDNIEDVELGKHGIYIKKGLHSGTFLPQVAKETGWTLEEFLGYCARDKAGIGWFGWKEAEIFTYEAFVFEE